MRALLGVFLLIGPLMAAAQEEVTVRYVSDEISVTLRKGEGMAAEVDSLLKAGTRVELLENGSEGYARVKVSPGREGWVLAKYLTPELPAREQLESMSAKFAESQAAVAQLEAQLSELKEQNARGPNAQNAVQAPLAEQAQETWVDWMTRGGLVMVGILLGMIFAQIRQGRRAKWSAQL